MSLITTIDWEKVAGLIPAIIQDNNSGQVLMLGYMNDEALTKTLATEQVTFWSRTKIDCGPKGKHPATCYSLKVLSSIVIKTHY